MTHPSETPPCNHLVGWLVIVGEDRADLVRAAIGRGLDSFVGDFGRTATVRAMNGVGFGLLTPKMALPLTTWSLWESRGGIGFVEGAFYDDCYSYRPADGEDPRLARLLLEAFERDDCRAVETLSGSFSGFYYDERTGALKTFVDRMSTRSVYWTVQEKRLVVSNNLAALRGLKPLALDPTAAFQYLTIGYPLGSRTLLSDVHVQPPSTVMAFEECSATPRRYWWVQDRDERAPLADAVFSVVQTVEEAVDRIARRSGGEVALGLSGGHDSRVLLGSLQYLKLPYVAITREDGNFNDAVVRSIGRRLDIPVIRASEIPRDQVHEVQREVFVYTDGAFVFPTGFSRLARQAWRQGLRVLMLGIGGDVVSGATIMPSPVGMTSLGQLAEATLAYYAELLSADEAAALLDTKHDVYEKTVSEWLATFPEPVGRQSLLDVGILQALANRELKSVLRATLPARRYVQVVCPYLDNKVLDAYFGLPAQALMNRRAQCYAGFYRFGDLGSYRAVSYPVSLRMEAAFPGVIHGLKWIRWKLRAMPVKPMFQGRRQDLSEEEKRRLADLRRSPELNHATLGEMQRRRRLGSRTLNRLCTLARFCEFYVRGRDA